MPDLHHLLNRDMRHSSMHRGIMLLVFLCVLLILPVEVASSQQERILTGRVSDALTDEPLKDVSIRILGWRWRRQVVRYEFHLTTNETGHYNTSLSRGYYWVIVLSDDPETPGIDYIPGILQDLDLWDRGSSLIQEKIVANFELVPGASIAITGSPEFVETGGVPEGVGFATVTSDRSVSPFLQSQSLTYYNSQIWGVLGLEAGLVIAPANVSISVIGMSGRMNFIADNDGYYYRLAQGSKTTIDISEAVMKRNAEIVRERLTSTWLEAKKLSLNGIDVKLEMDDMDTAFISLDSARSALSEGSYAECFINLRAAYIMDEDVRLRIANILSDATFSPIPLSFLFVLSSFGLASVFVERNTLRIGVGILSGLLLLSIYFYISPGWRLTDPILLLASCVLAGLMAIALNLLLPRIRKDITTPSGIALTSSLTSTFSLATRNLKRRRLRSLLILISILTLVFSFTVFTSFQIQTTVASGRPSTPYPKAEPPTGLMIVAPPGPAGGSSLPTSIVEVLKADPLVSSVAPKTESSPTYMEAQITSESGENITIRGVIGVSDHEVFMNNLDLAVIEGHYIQEEEQRAILISAKSADQLDVVSGSKVQFTWLIGSAEEGIYATDIFTVVGILDDQIFEQIVDLDGQPIRPYILIDHDVVYLTADNIAVFNWEEVMSLGIGRLTRINVQAESSSDIVPLAAQLVRAWRWFVYTSVDNDVRLFYYKKDPTLAGGSTVPMLLVLVGLNILACTLNAVYERKKEIATLSLVGLNPSQVTYIFLAEAGLVAFIGGVIGYLVGVGGPRILLSLGGPGFLTEKISWLWSVAVIMMAIVVAVSASALPALRASTVATPKLPLKWKLEYLPAAKDMWLLHIPQLVSQLELRRFFSFIEGKFEEMQLLRTIPEKMEKMDLVEEFDEEKDLKKFLFSHSFAQEGSRAFRTENELVATRSRGSSTYALDLAIRMAMLYNYEPMEVVRKTASAVRKLMLQWAATPSSVRWGLSKELIQVENLSVVSKGKTLIKRISVDVMRGEILGLTGEGRRAFILATAGLCRPSGGLVQLGGIDTYSRRDEIKKTIGVVLQGTELYEELSPRRNLRFLAKLEERENVEKVADEILERCNLKQHADETISSLSREARRRLVIAQALIKEPSVLLLEDPFAGLKDHEAAGIRNLLKDLNRWEGTTIICSGQNVEQLEFCNRTLLLKAGLLDTIIGGKDAE